LSHEGLNTLFTGHSILLWYEQSACTQITITHLWKEGPRGCLFFNLLTLNDRSCGIYILMHMLRLHLYLCLIKLEKGFMFLCCHQNIVIKFRYLKLGLWYKQCILANIALVKHLPFNCFIIRWILAFVQSVRMHFIYYWKRSWSSSRSIARQQIVEYLVL